jgi:hypothetical protein
MLRRFRMLMATLAVAGLTAGVVLGVASATPATVGGGWQQFNWTGGDGTIADESPFTFAAATPVFVTVTDVACKGDRFTISDGPNTLGRTSLVPVGDCPGIRDTDDPDEALADPTYSHGRFLVRPGSHSIGVEVSTSPFGSGGAFIRFDAAFISCSDPRVGMPCRVGGGP